MVHSILIVEDDSGVLETLTALLVEERFRVMTAKNGREALEVLARFRPSIIVLDLLMPVMNGYELVERLNSDENLADIPVVVVSGASSGVDGSAAFFPKPLDLSALLAKLREICGGERVFA